MSLTFRQIQEVQSLMGRLETTDRQSVHRKCVCVNKDPQSHRDERIQIGHILQNIMAVRAGQCGL